MLRSFHPLHRLLAALARLAQSGHNGQRGDPPPYRPRRSSRQPPPPTRVHLLLASKNAGADVQGLPRVEERHYPTEKMFLREMLESMRVDLEIARARLGGSDVGLDTTGGGSGGGGDDDGDGDEE